MAGGIEQLGSFGEVDGNCADGPCCCCASPQVPKPEKHGSGNDSDYDNTQIYDVSLRSDSAQVTVLSFFELFWGNGFTLIANTKHEILPILHFRFKNFIQNLEINCILNTEMHPQGKM